MKAKATPTPRSPEEAARLLKAREQQLGKPGEASEDAPIGWNAGVPGDDVPGPGDEAPARGFGPVLAAGAAGDIASGAPVIADGGRTPASSFTPGVAGSGSAPQGFSGGSAPVHGGSAIPAQAGGHDMTPIGRSPEPAPLPSGAAGGQVAVAVGQAASAGAAGGHADVPTGQAGPAVSAGVHVPADGPTVVTGSTQPGGVATSVAAVITGTDTGTETEDRQVTGGKITTGGQLTVTDPDAGQDHFTAQTNVAGTYGSFSIDASGHWTYSADNTQIAVQQLRAGTRLADTLQVTSADGTSHTVTVTINGTNDAPVLLAQTQAVTEDGGQLTGHMVATDVDSGDTQAFSTNAHIAGFTLNADGGYSFDPADAAYQHLAAGQTQTLIVAVTVTDSAGATATQNLAITVTGTNDGATITGTDTGALTEDTAVTSAGAIETSGQLTITDVDSGEAHFAAQSGVAGTYGQFGIDASGHWTYQAFNGLPAIQRLQAGDTLTDSFTVASADGTTHTITVTINGTNDAPQVSQTNAAARMVTEDSPTTTVGGVLHSRDVDAGDTLTWAVGNGGQGTYGHLDFDAQTGKWTYHLDNANANANALGAGQTGNEVFQITATDSKGATGTTTVRIAVLGANDGAVIAGTDTGTVTEDSHVTGGKIATSGTLTVTDPDVGQDHFNALVSNGHYGVFTLDAAGQWTYSADNSKPEIQHLKAGETKTDSFTVSSADGTSHTLTVTVAGSNDAPSLLVRSHAVAEDGTQVTGNARVDDLDTGDTHTFSLAHPVAGFTLNADGSYSFDPSDAAYQHLAQGQRLNVAIDITVTDGSGASDTQPLFITVTGTNDGAVVSGVDSGRVGEDATLTTGGKLVVTDIDDNQAVFTAQTNVAGTYGSFSLATDGTWTYQLDNTKSEVQALRAGETRTENFIVASADGTTHTVTVTVTGANDAPLLQAQSQSVTEDGAQLTGHLVATDVDAGDTQAFSTANPVAGFTLNPDGSYSFDPSDAAYQHLAAGQTQDVIIPVAVTDSAGATAMQNLTITVTGTNDTPAVSGALVDVVTEDGSVVQTHNLPVMDFSKNLDGAVMTMGALATGDMTELSAEFSVISDGQAINSDHHGATFLSYASSVHNNDFYVWRPDNLTICIGNEEHPTGINIDDGGSHRVSVVWSSATGSLDVLVDGVVRHHADGYQQGYAITGGGTLVLGQDQDNYAPQNGSTPWDAWGFDTPDAFAGKLFNVAISNHAVGVQALTHTPLDQLLHQDPSLVVNIQAGSNGQIVDTTGHNQLMVYPGTTIQTVAVDSGLSGNQGVQSADGQLQAVDVDDGQSGFQALSSTTGTYGTFSMDAQGRWHYQLDNASPQTQALLEGQQVVDRFTVLTIDGTPVTVAITVIGRNDVAVVSGVDSGQVTEDANIDTQGRLTATGDLQVADVDVGQAHFQLATLTGSAGVLTLDASGHWEYHVDNSLPAVQKLGDAQVLNERFTVSTVDGTQHTISVTIHGKDDGATITGTDTGTVTEDSHVTGGKIATSGALTVTDPDVGQDHFNALVSNGHYGVFTLDAAGHWTYAADNSKPEIQHLKAGETKTDSFTVTSADGTTHTVAVTIQGTNDAPSLLVRSHAVAEDGSQVTGNARVDDLDTGDTHTFSLAHPVAGFTLNADGSYRFDPSDAAYQHLQQGQKLNLSVDITVTDGSGASDTQPIFITLTGTNDGAVVSGVDSGAVTEDSTLTTGGKLTVSDIDDHEAVFIAQNNVAGTYGSFSIGTDGTWTYQLDNTKSEVQALKAGETKTENIVVTSADGTTHAITVTINGKDDGAVIAGTDTGTVTEDLNTVAGKISTSGQLTVSDPDAGQDHFTAQTNAASTYGGFTLDAAGHWTYAADNSNPAIQGLKAGATLSDSLTVTSADGTTRTVSVTIQGINDAPTIQAQTQAVTEDGSQLSGQMVATEVDTGDSQTFSAQNPPAGFSLNTDGSYSFDPANAAYQHLAAGQTQTLTIPVTVTDSAGATATQNLTITLTGTNDGATITGTDSGTVIEDTRFTTGGKLFVTDIDDQEAVFAVQNNAASTYGSFTLAADGTWSYKLDNHNSAVNALQKGSTLTDSVTATSADGTTHTISVTIQGHNDDPFLMVRSHAVLEDASQLTGTVLVSDPDTGDTATFTTTAQIAGFTLNADGSYSFDPSDAAYQHLAQGQKLTLSIPIAVTDSQGAQNTQPLIIGLTGSNDGAVITGVDKGAVTEDTQLTTSGQLIVTDIDDKEAAFTGQANTAGTYGSFTLAANGSWTYTLDNANPAIQALAQGGKLSDTLTVQSVDGSSHQITVTINGQGDAAVIGGVDSGKVIEDSAVTAGKISTSGQLTVTDPDVGQDHFTAQSNVAGTYGSFTLDAAGHWTYAADNSKPEIQHLKAGETKTDSFTVTSADGTTHTVAVTIQGTNDAPSLLVRSHAVAEDGSQVTGNARVDDLDTGDTHTFSLAHPVAGFTLNADGSYRFDPSDAAYQHLQQGQKLNLSVDITVTDGSGASDTQPLFITLTGTNDGAVVSGRVSNSLTEDAVVSTSGMLRAGGQLTVVDPDAGEAVFVAQTGVSGAGHYGSFSIDASGHYSYTADNSQTAIQQLKAGETLTDRFTVTTADGTQQVVTITINGAEDKPVLQAQTHAVTEDGTRLTGQMLATDVDAGDTQRFSIAQQIAGFSLNTDGSYSFDPANTAYQHLAAGQTQTLTIPVTVTDSAGATATQNLTLTLNGTNDGARISGADRGSVTEDSTLTTGGKLEAKDIDDHEAVITAQSNVAGTYGSFGIGTDGSWSYQLDNAKAEVQALKAGESRTDSFTVASADGTQHTVTVTINGQDDGAVIAGTDSGAVTEDVHVTAGNIATGGTLTVSDGDVGQDHFTAQAAVAGHYGSFTLTEQGAWTYEAANNKPEIQQLRAGQSLTESFTATSADGTTHTVTVTINGTNDMPRLLVRSHAVTEDGSLLSGKVSVDDIDAGDTQSFSLTNAVAGFTLNADGSYSFNPSDAAYQHLKGGEVQTLTIPVTVTDSAGATDSQPVVIRLTGSNDGAVIKGVDTGTVTEDTLTSASGKLTVSDIDTGEAAFQPQTHAGSFGSFTLAADGNWTYSLDNNRPSVQALGSHDLMSDTITVKSVDGTIHRINVDIKGSGDRAVIQGTDTGEVTEDKDVQGGLLRTQGHLGVVDPDASQDAFVAQSALVGRYGHLNVDATGIWTYEADNSGSRVQELREGAEAVDHFVVHSLDGTTHSIRVVIHGTNDAPTVSAASRSVTEDGALLFGQLRVTDPDRGDQQEFELDHPVAGFTLSDDGTYRFDPKDPTYQGLAEGQVLRLQVPVTVTDFAGAKAHQFIGIAITGSNDAPVIAGQAQIATEDGAPLHGRMVATDVDTGDTQTFTLSHPVDGFTLNADGSYTFDPSHASYQHLSAGQADVLTIPVTVTDHAGASSVQDLVITLVGADELLPPTLQLPPTTQLPGLIQAPPDNHVLQSHMVQSGDIFDQLIASFMQTNDPAYQAVARAMQAGDVSKLYSVELTVNGGGILFTDAQGSVSAIHPVEGQTASSTVNLGHLVSFHQLNPGSGWVQIYDPLSATGPITPSLHSPGGTGLFFRDPTGVMLSTPHADQVAHPINVRYFAPPDDPAPPAPAPDHASAQHQDDPTPSFDDLLTHSHSGAVIDLHHTDSPTDNAHHDAAVAPDSQHDALAATDSAGLHAPIADYMQFADTSAHASTAGGSEAAHSSPLDDYLAAAGVDPHSVQLDIPEMPPTEVLLDAAVGDGQNGPDSAQDDLAADDAAAAAAAVEVIDTTHEQGQQHHGV